MAMEKRNTRSSDMGIVKLWALRCLVMLKGHKSLLVDVIFSSEQLQLASFIGLEKTLCIESDFIPSEVLEDLKQLYIVSEAKKHRFPRQLESNLETLSKAIDISEAEKTLLGFLITLQNEPVLYTAMETLGHVSSKRAVHYFSVILSLDEHELRTIIFKSNSMLMRAGLVTQEFFGGTGLCGKLNVFSQEFAEQMYSFALNKDELFKIAVNRSPKANLKRSDYEYLSNDFSLADTYLKGVKQAKIIGANILIYGPPGTGKTELARTLASSSKNHAFDVVCEDEDFDPISSNRRLNAYCLAQNLLQPGGSIVVFDEAEDIFNDGNWLSGVRSTAQQNKAWFNRLLEENRVPAIWITNDISQIDPAYIRRFNLAIEVLSPPSSHLKSVLNKACNGLVDVQSKSDILIAEGMTPALITQAGKVLQNIESQTPEADLDTAFYSIVNSVLKAQGYEGVKPKTNAHMLPDYDFSCVNSPDDLTLIMNGLVNTKQGRVCLFGPPGTGKTEFGRELSKRTGLKLFTQKVSDLVSPYVGESERNISLAFERASDENSILLIDEVDSFLRDRRMANQNWEVTMVNEMLTQMESFQGLMIASTNLMNDFDQAVLRRFDIKIKLDFLLPEQSWLLFKKYCKFLGMKGVRQELQKELSACRNLAPGDFATIARRAKLMPLGSPRDVLNALMKEAEWKEGSSTPIGFIH